MAAHNPDLPYSDLVVLSDIHCGSVYGLWPPGFEMSGGGVYGLNKGQAYLWKCWLNAAEAAGQYLNIAGYVINGDAIDGSHRKWGAHEAVTVNAPDQADAFEICLRAFMERAGTAPLFCVQGTEAHDARAGAEMERIAKNMGAVQYKGIGSGLYSKEVLDLTVHGQTINFSHGVGVSGGLYRATAPDREGVWSALAGKEGKLPKASVCVRSHAHYYVLVEHESKTILITPTWQLQTRYMRRHSPYRMLPSIGVVAIRVWKEEAPQFGDGRVQILKRLYALPEYKAHKLSLEQVLRVAESVERGESGE